jgi:hypothetical protein
MNATETYERQKATAVPPVLGRLSSAQLTLMQIGMAGNASRAYFAKTIRLR